MYTNLFFMAIFLVPFCHANTDLIEIHKKQFYCGRHLDNVMSELCSWFNNDDAKASRFRRSIILDCCYKPCSKRFILNYYCPTPKSEYLNILNLPEIEKLQLDKNKNNELVNVTQITRSSIQKNRLYKLKTRKRKGLKRNYRCSCTRHKRLKVLHNILKDKNRLTQSPVVGYRDDNRPIIMLKNKKI